jgi:hypothetical protein
MNNNGKINTWVSILFIISKSIFEIFSVKLDKLTLNVSLAVCFSKIRVYLIQNWIQKKFLDLKFTLFGQKISSLFAKFLNWFLSRFKIDIQMKNWIIIAIELREALLKKILILI